jgi:SAM-dependent methyltransferase
VKFSVADNLVDLACDCCGAHNEEQLLRKAGTLTGALFNVVRCRNCGFVYINPRLTEQGIVDLYDEAYYGGKGFDTFVDYTADYAKSDDDAKTFHPLKTASALRAYHQPPARLLDFGCGLGDLMRQARTLGYDAEGFEVSPFARAFARDQGFVVYERFEQLPAGSYDLVSAIEVLEHCFRPSIVFDVIYRVLKPGGTFIYTTYNIDRFVMAYRLGLQKDHDYIHPEGHINFFGRNVVKRFFKRSGFRGLAPSFEPYLVGPKGQVKAAMKRALRLDLPAARK